MPPLADRVAVVAGATRGAGRGIARMLGEAGATVYCTGRSVAGHPPASGPYAGRPETIEQTAALVTAAGGRGVAVRTDHARESDVRALADRVGAGHDRLDIVVMNFWGDEAKVPFGRPFWTLPLGAAKATIDATLWPHVLTLQALTPLMLRGRPGQDLPPGLVVEVADGPALYYRTSLFYDLAATLRIRLAYTVAEELAPSGIAALAVTPGYLRSERTLEMFGVTDDNWRDAGARDPNFLASETPCLLGRGVAALAGDARVARFAGGLYGSWDLAREYGLTDIDGSRPDFGRHMAASWGESPGPLHTVARWRIARAD